MHCIMFLFIIYAFVHLFMYSLSYSFIHSFIIHHSLNPSFIHSLNNFAVAGFVVTVQECGEIAIKPANTGKHCRVLQGG